MIAALVLVTIVTQAQVPPRDARPVTAGGTATVSGVVVSADPQPRPLRRARVTLNGPGLAMGRTAITADDGSFSFDRVTPGRVTLAAIKEGYVAMSYGATRTGRPGTGVEVADGQSVRVSIRLPRGAVITGTVVDVDGLPSQGIAVTVLAQRYIGQQGERRYLGAGSPALAVADDRGVYRIFGLPAGDYVVAAQPQARQAGLPGADVRTVARGVVSDKGLALSQVFHPGATEVGRASRVSVRAGEERSGIDIQLQYVPLATISGVASGGQGFEHMALTMVRADEVVGFDPVRSAHAAADGRFTFNGVPPGRYRVIASSREASVPLSGSAPPAAPGSLRVASLDVTVDGEDIANLALSLEPALKISGRVVFEGARPGPALPNVRVSVPAVFTIANAGQAMPSLKVEGSTFTVDGIVPGLYRAVGTWQGVRAPIGPWWLKSLVVSGRDVLDAPLDLRQSADDAVAAFADTASDLSGAVKDAQGNAVTDHFVVVASTDRSTWFFNSRRVVGVRTDAQGRYSIRNLPPGEYRVAAALDLEQGEWFDPAVLERLLPVATPLTIAGPERKTVDLTIR